MRDEKILVELVVVMDRKDNRVQEFQLSEVLWRQLRKDGDLVSSNFGCFHACLAEDQKNKIKKIQERDLPF